MAPAGEAVAGQPQEQSAAEQVRVIGVDAHEAMFVDDLSRNVDAAEALGMTGVVADSDRTVVDAVDELLEAN